MSEEPTEIAWQGKWITAKRKGRWEFVSRAREINAVAIIAIDDGHVLLVDQFRVPLGRRCLEIPAGLIGDEFDSDDYEQAARRELEEETGYRCEQVEVLGEFHSTPGLASEGFTLVRVTGLSRIGEGGGTEDEDIIVHRVPLAGLAEFVAAKRAEGLAIDVKLLTLLGAAMLGL